MIRTQLRSDKMAMTLSLACVVHCFFAPSFIILSSGFLALSVDNEFVHKVIVFAAVPVSAYALLVGYRNHNTASFIPLGIFGLSILILAVILGESTLGEAGEKGLTLCGSIMVAYAHFRNYQTCKKADCSCHEIENL